MKKKQNKKVYIVTKGSYSDKSNEAAFSNKVKAAEYIQKINDFYDGSNRYSGINDYIEELELDPSIEFPKSPHPYKNFYFVKIYRNGDVETITQEFYDPFHPEEMEERYHLHQQSNFNPEKHQFDNYYILFATVNANDKKQALKKVFDKRSFLLRTNKWIEVADRLNGPSIIKVD